MPMPKRKPGVKKCARCEKTFEYGGRGRPKRRQRFCSGRCQALSRVVHARIARLSVRDRAYIAGILDGEGSIVLWDRGNGGRLQLRVSVANTHQGLVDYLCSITNCGSVVRHEFPPEKGYKTSLTWQVYGSNAVSLLKQLLPLLIVKRERAIVAIESQSVRKIPAGSGRGRDG